MYDMICEHCKGLGVEDDFRYIQLESNIVLKTKMCSICLGSGKLDWIEKITGKKRQLKPNDALIEYTEELMHRSSSIVKDTT